VLTEITTIRQARILRAAIILCFIVFAAVVRILPHPWNFTPVGAMALFSGAKLGRTPKAFVLPLSALLFGDFFVGFYRIMPLVYLSFCLSVLIGIFVRNRQSPVSLSIATLLGAAQFFLITNWAMWAFGTTYAKSLGGLLSCYTAGITYFGNTLAGDAFYALLLFGGFALVERTVPKLRSSASVPAEVIGAR
jgi:hypothetical protein